MKKMNKEIPTEFQVLSRTLRDEAREWKQRSKFSFSDFERGKWQATMIKMLTCWDSAVRANVYDKAADMVEHAVKAVYNAK